MVEKNYTCIDTKQAMHIGLEEGKSIIMYLSQCNLFKEIHFPYVKPEFVEMYK